MGLFGKTYDLGVLNQNEHAYLSTVMGHVATGFYQPYNFSGKADVMAMAGKARTAIEHMRKNKMHKQDIETAIFCLEAAKRIQIENNMTNTEHDQSFIACLDSAADKLKASI